MLISIKKIFTLIVLLISSWLATKAQDLSFSQFYNVPVYLNPALTGKFNAQLRASVHYRTQYNQIQGPAPYRSIAGSVDAGLLRDVLNDDVFGVGLMVISDNQNGGILQTQRILASVAYHKGIGYKKKHFLSAGFQFDLFHRGLNINALDFEDEFSGTDFSGITQENIDNSSIWVPNFNVGLYWSSAIGKKWNLFSGISIHNIITPQESFLLNSNGERNIRYTANAGFVYDLNKVVLISPNAYYLHQNPSSQLIAGSTFGFNLSGKRRPYQTIIYAGGWYNFNGAIIGTTGIQYKGFQASFSYDNNIGDIQTAANNFGAFELSLVFVTRPIDKKKEYHILHCPKF